MSADDRTSDSVTPQYRNGTSDDEAGDRTGDADVEERPLRGKRFLDPNHGAERAGQEERGRGNEIGQRRIDVVPPAERVVAELVRAQGS